MNKLDTLIAYIAYVQMLEDDAYWEVEGANIALDNERERQAFQNTYESDPECLEETERDVARFGDFSDLLAEACA